MSRQINTSRTIKIPKGVTVQIKSRRVRVKGPRGVLERDFRHINCELNLSKDGQPDVLSGSGVVNGH